MQRSERLTSVFDWFSSTANLRSSTYIELGHILSRLTGRRWRCSSFRGLPADFPRQIQRVQVPAVEVVSQGPDFSRVFQRRALETWAYSVLREWDDDTPGTRFHIYFEIRVLGDMKFELYWAMVDGEECPSTYLQDTAPSDYDLSKPWSCTIGKVECEVIARTVVRWLQAHGDDWAWIPWSVMQELEVMSHAYVRYLKKYFPSPRGFFIPEDWLARLQRMRTPRPGPPAPTWVANAAWTGVALEYPNGHRRALPVVGHVDEQLANHSRVRQD
jgi:hypothetical protein